MTSYPEWLSPTPAARDRWRKQRWAYGERNGSAKLSRVEVDEIRRIGGRGGVKQTEIARRYGVSQVAVSMILRRQTWV